MLNALKLENQLCFPLYAASKEVIRHYKNVLGDLDMTYTQYIAMLILWEKKSVTVNELGSFLYLDSGTLTPMLKKMESKKLITRTRSEMDERKVKVEITEFGQSLKAKAESIPEKMSICMKLTKEEGETLYKLLYKLINTLQNDE
ncbi:MAG: MarR family transcriptional regulator [Ruminococcus sp.]|jgi:DNA-binding MarR family transcriptional regulator|nr:MarR family transcriptional regulator [Ruminococcus sp.]